jgi:hypothetical protein
LNVLLIHQGRPEAVKTAAEVLSANGHASRAVSAAELDLGERSASGGADAVIVFPETYREKETLELCRRLRESPAFGDTPLLAAVNMYQMPLANSVKSMPDAAFVFTPIEAEDLIGRLARLTGREAPGADDQGG